MVLSEEIEKTPGVMEAAMAIIAVTLRMGLPSYPCQAQPLAEKFCDAFQSPTAGPSVNLTPISWKSLRHVLMAGLSVKIKCIKTYETLGTWPSTW